MQPDVADALRHGPFHYALRVAIKARGLPLERLRQRLVAAGAPVGMATLSSWQSGRRRPERPESMDAVVVLETILGLPQRALVDLLGAPRRRGPGPRVTKAPRPFGQVLRQAEPVVELMAEMDWRDDRLRVVSAWDLADVAAGSRLVAVETSVVLHAVTEVDRYLTVYYGAPGIDLRETVQFEALSDCRVGRVLQARNHPLLVAELLLDRPVPAGETVIVRFRVTDIDGNSDTEFCRFLRAPAQQVAVEVRFAPDARPQRCWRFVREREGWPDQRQDELRLGPSGHVHVVRNAVQPGFVGIGWEP
ncbi:hypothetical protein GCM10010124_28570 [Pilimelia terevasa]|uniref:Uncharacterized protein n=1 Tax=Pilimelia terevasa TaxID=53372 RepID=A0A8J3FJN8_9ACTN|nr:hypothetical protein [Pilimelia terevasa]GGK34234.1 hypothetical protein GCM10010124_28570 [Pilimelia terevasa]